MIRNGRRRLEHTHEYSRRKRRFQRLQMPILATISANSITSICCRFVVPTSRTDTSHKSRRRPQRRTCEQHKRVDVLLLFTSPKTLCVVPVSCAEIGDYSLQCRQGLIIITRLKTWWILCTNWLDLYAELSQWCTKQKLRMCVNLRIYFVSHRRGISK